jgi:prophage regulatory protein
MTDKFLRRSDVEAATGLSKPTIYRRIGEGTFPRPVPIGGRAVRWRESDVAAWQQRLVENASAG